MTLDVTRILIGIFVFVFSCVFHECAHVWVALKLGDPTGKNEGRLTLNPISHIDPFWSILLPLLTFIGRGVPFGGPKPAPVNPLNFENPRVGFMWTALAGPATNLLLAAGGLALLWILHAVAPDFVLAKSYNALFFVTLIIVNVILAAFNLIPIPPLDGSRFLQYVLGDEGERTIAWLERLSILPLLFVLHFVWPLVSRPVVQACYTTLALVFEDKYAWELVTHYFQR